jgi:hypothetical protein
VISKYDYKFEKKERKRRISVINITSAKYLSECG